MHGSFVDQTHFSAASRLYTREDVLPIVRTGELKQVKRNHQMAVPQQVREQLMASGPATRFAMQQQLD